MQALKHIGLFLKDFAMGKKYQLFQPSWLIISWNQTLKLKLTILTVSFNNSTIPNSLNYDSTDRLSSFCVNEEVILKIINALNINKAHGHNDISIRMFKLCGKSVVKLLSMIFNNCIDTGTFPDIWKQSNIIPVHKKDDKQIVDQTSFQTIDQFPFGLYS